MNRSIILILIINIIASVFIVASSHSWFSIWVGLELNTLSILPILCGQFTPRGVESTIKYFLVQAFSAAMVLNVALVQLWLCSSWSVDCPLNDFSSVVLTLALCLKLGLFPCHYWFPDVIQGLSFLQGLLLSTWQKIAPFIILVSVCSILSINILTVLGCLSVLVGGWGGLNQSQIRKIMAFSSISHLGWICSVLSYSWYISCVMFLVYIILSSSIFLINNEAGLFNLSCLGRLMYHNNIMGIILILIILSLGGLPPLTGFLNKFVALECLLSNNLLAPCVVLIVGSLLSLFFYLRISFNSVLCLFPQHSMMVFSWRSANNSFIKVNTYTIILSALSSISILGLVLMPVSWCYY
nr:NADH dehydrogenase subunit 2 [Asterias amurensis]UYK51685.1 NADH dehydrogenase subunit 2 [Asterias amurensis]WGS93910.1 NADH dehydrogenase subunit 2 [Asterias amurensis]WGS93923.1 NADH dehydrogenase subunit 2 [Asterias amurensis]WGS93936.1 NADH dehydrogenase subunit 2 [Asterias amurensis]